MNIPGCNQMMSCSHACMFRHLGYDPKSCMDACQRTPDSGCTSVWGLWENLNLCAKCPEERMNNPKKWWVMFEFGAQFILLVILQVACLKVPVSTFYQKQVRKFGVPHPFPDPKAHCKRG